MASGFVGRGNELGRLEAVCSQAKRESRPAVALVNGVPGSGKTRLLAELRGREVSSRQLSMVGYQTGSQVPLAAAGDLLRELVKVSGAGARLEASLFGADQANDRPLEPLRMFEAAHRSLLRLESVILLLVDDLQWIDELSLALQDAIIFGFSYQGVLHSHTAAQSHYWWACQSRVRW